MKKTLFGLVVGMVAFSPALLRAEETKPASRPSREELREKWKDLTPAEREAKMKEWREKNPGGARSGDPRGAAAEKLREERKELARQVGLDPDQLKDMSIEERMKKFREAAEIKAAELNKKKEAGTITADEQKLLDRLDQIKKGAEDFSRRREGADAGKGNPRDARRPAVQGEGTVEKKP